MLLSFTVLYILFAGAFVAYVAFGNIDIKLRAERFLSSITNSFEIVLQRNIEVRIVLLTDGDASMNSANQILLPDSLMPKQIDTSEVIHVKTKGLFGCVY